MKGYRTTHRFLAAAGLTVVLVATLAAQCKQPETTQPPMPTTTKTIYFAGGCFWGTEHFFKQVRGVVATRAGYANGTIDNPTYEEVCTETTGFAETVEVVYAPEQISLERLIDLYFKTIDPTSLNRQGNDRGTRYRTGIYYTDPTEAAIVTQALETVAAAHRRQVVVENLPLRNFYAAEEYHQDYLDKHPAGYCHIHPELFRMAREANPLPAAAEYRKKSDDELKTELTPLQFDVTRRNATERPFANEYWDEFREGIYVDITTGEPLFASTDKFESGCGWPAFSKPIDKRLIVEQHDASHGMQRTEVRSKTGDAHLGHVFTDGPQALGGLRYCINSASLRFIPKERMEAEGYAAYLPLLTQP